MLFSNATRFVRAAPGEAGDSTGRSPYVVISDYASVLHLTQARSRLQWSDPTGLSRPWSGGDDAIPTAQVNGTTPHYGTGVPMLVLAGETDHAHGQTLSERIAETAPRTTWQVMAGAGHSVVHERPEPVNAAVLAWVALMLQPA